MALTNVACLFDVTNRLTQGLIHHSLLKPIHENSYVRTGAMALTPTKAAVLILKHHGVSACVVGELALNYYNVPRVRHVSLDSGRIRWPTCADKLYGIEICVPETSFVVAADYLCSTGLFEPCEADSEYNNYTAYKRGLPQLRTTGWVCPAQNLLILPSSFFGFGDAFKTKLIDQASQQETFISKEMVDLDREDIVNLPLPRLAPLLAGLSRRYLEEADDTAMMSVEQLIDGMNLDEEWVEKNLEQKSEIKSLILRQIKGKKPRIDYCSDNAVTCFIGDNEEAKNVRLIAGFSEPDEPKEFSPE